MSSDPNSYSNFYEVKQTKIHLVLTADFTQKVLFGSCTLTVVGVSDTASKLVLDTKGLTIKKVTLQSSSGSLELKHHLGEISVVEFGQALTIEHNFVKGQEALICVEYQTSPEASAIQWLEPSQTSGKTHPYLFTQCQAIHARSMYPCQDTCSSKVTYDAEITVPEGLVALMSATRVKQEKNTFFFTQKVSMPTYLVALAIGDLVSRDIGPRSKVWSEPSQVDAAAFEFTDTELFLKTAEDLLGPYVWGVYDILLLPASFPYGGMENPQLTFVTPTLIAGDKSLANVVIHEIIHSWCGNLVTNKTWKHFWLNEGFTVFNERKVIGRIEGEKAAQLHHLLGLYRLQESVDQFGADSQLTALTPNLEGIDPDDAFSSVPYEKGCNFLVYLENLVGGPTVFEPFIKAWIQKYSVVTSEDFKEFFLSSFSAVPKEKIDSIEWDRWFTEPGMPIVENKFDDTLAQQYKKLAEKWISDGGKDASEKDVEGWNPNQTMGLLDALVAAKCVLTHEQFEKMGSLYKISESKNSEIVFLWCKLGLDAEYPPIIQKTINFLLSQGRMKFTRPLYRALYASKIGKESAFETFNTHRSSYHSICSRLVAKDLGLEK